MRRPIVFATLMALMVVAASCGGKKAPTKPQTPEEIAEAARKATDENLSGAKLDPKKYEEAGLIKKPPEVGQGTFGYNEPLENMWHNGVGLRAVSQDRAIAVSVHNRTGVPLQMYPHQFRLLLPDRTLYQFNGDTNDLLWFPDKPIPHGGRELFVVGVPDLPQLVGLGLVYQYPPRKVMLKVEVEATALPSGPQ